MVSYKKPSKGYHCWLTNITKNKIVLSDLKFTLQPNQTIDILDSKHSNYTVEEINASIKTGSIGARLNKSIFVRILPPKKHTDRKIEMSKVSFPYKQRSIVEVEEVDYEELHIGISDEEYADDNAEIAGAESEIHLADAKKITED